MAEELPENAIQPATRVVWRRWLERSHARDNGVWFVYFGWLDGQARAHFEAFPASARKAMLKWVRQAKRPETRARRIAEAARMAGANARMTGTSLKAARHD
jgi:uncharacterized protein YdeI (YjbR/CyaY-like superfamily)